MIYPPIQLSADKWAFTPFIPPAESVRGPVVVFPSAKDIIAAAAGIVIVLVTPVVVTQGDLVAAGIVIALRVLVMTIPVVRSPGQAWFVA